MNVKSRKGDWAELLATAYLMSLNYEVFMNASCVGPVDVVALNPETGEIMLFDVKKITTILDRESGELKRIIPRLNDVQCKLGVKLVCVQDNGEVFIAD